MDDKILLGRLKKILPANFTDFFGKAAVLKLEGEERVVQHHFHISEECLKLLEQYHLNLTLPLGDALAYRQALAGIVPEDLLTLLELHATKNYNGTSAVN